MDTGIAADLRIKEVAALRFAIAELEARMWQRALEAQRAGARLEDIGQAAAVSRETARKRLQLEPPADAGDQRVTVRVELRNDAGETFTAARSAASVDEAVAIAERECRSATADDTWTMSDWSAA